MIILSNSSPLQIEVVFWFLCRSSPWIQSKLKWFKNHSRALFFQRLSIKYLNVVTLSLCSLTSSPSTIWFSCPRSSYDLSVSLSLSPLCQTNELQMFPWSASDQKGCFVFLHNAWGGSFFFFPCEVCSFIVSFLLWVPQGVWQKWALENEKSLIPYAYSILQHFSSKLLSR